MTQEQISKVLDPAELFSQRGTDNERGTGFGLGLCKQFAERHGGRLEIESTAALGSKVMFSLPALAPDEQERPSFRHASSLEEAV